MLGLELDRAVQGFPLKDWLVDCGFAAGRKDEYTATCPRCLKPEKLCVNVLRRRWHCWACARQETRTVGGVAKLVTVEGAGGVLRLIAWWYSVTLGAAARWLIKVVRPEALELQRMPSLDLAAQVVDEDPGPRSPPAPPEGAGALSDGQRAYLHSRGIDDALMAAYGLFGCHEGRYRNRIVFPAWGRDRELLYWQARATWSAADDEARGRHHIKVLNPPRSDPELSSDDVVFNLDRAVTLGHGSIVLCEGPISAIKAGDDAVALWGKRLYPAQLRAIVTSGAQAADVMFDGPTAREPNGAWQEAIQTANLLSLFLARVRLVRVEAGDPGDYDRMTNAWRRAHATAVLLPGVARI